MSGSFHIPEAIVQGATQMLVLCLEKTKAHYISVKHLCRWRSISIQKMDQDQIHTEGNRTEVNATAAYHLEPYSSRIGQTSSWVCEDKCVFRPKDNYLKRTEVRRELD